MARMTFRGKAYRGRDMVTGFDVRAERGDQVEVSDEKARQLAADFPGEWELISITTPDKAEEPKREDRAAEPKEEKQDRPKAKTPRRK